MKIHTSTHLCRSSCKINGTPLQGFVYIVTHSHTYKHTHTDRHIHAHTNRRAANPCLNWGQLVGKLGASWKPGPLQLHVILGGIGWGGEGWGGAGRGGVGWGGAGRGGVGWGGWEGGRILGMQ